MKISRKFIGQAALFIAATAFLSSCNRGYGCPNNFDMDNSAVEVIKTIIALIS